MYLVQCRSPRKYCRWVNYSSITYTVEEAEAIKARAEARHNLDLDSNELIYRIVTAR